MSLGVPLNMFSVECHWASFPGITYKNADQGEIPHVIECIVIKLTNVHTLFIRIYKMTIEIQKCRINSLRPSVAYKRL